MKRYITCAEEHCVEIESPDGDWVRAEDAKAEIDRLRAVLKQIEWIDRERPHEQCPVCNWEQPRGHEPGCELALALGCT